MVSMALEVEEEECLVALLIDARDVHRPTKSNTKLIAMRIRAREPAQVIEVVVRVECAITQVIVYVSVQTAASGFGDYVNDVPGAPAVLGCERILLHLELLNVIRRWDIDHTA